MRHRYVYFEMELDITSMQADYSSSKTYQFNGLRQKGNSQD